jgi:hypothetical protein
MKLAKGAHTAVSRARPARERPMGETHGSAGSMHRFWERGGPGRRAPPTVKGCARREKWAADGRRVQARVWQWAEATGVELGRGKGLGPQG